MTSTRPTVLIVEDEHDLADLFATWLEGRYECRVAYDGEAALESVDPDVDVILLDRRMPGLSGDEVLDLVRDQGLECPIGMVTAVEPDFDIVAMGFDDYVVKPVVGDELREFVADLLAVSEYDQEIRRYYQLVSKRAALETTKQETELTENEEYQLLLEELEQVRDAADRRRETLSPDDFSRLF